MKSLTCKGISLYNMVLFGGLPAAGKWWNSRGHCGFSAGVGATDGLDVAGWKRPAREVERIGRSQGLSQMWRRRAQVERHVRPVHGVPPVRARRLYRRGQAKLRLDEGKTEAAKAKEGRKKKRRRIEVVGRPRKVESACPRVRGAATGPESRRRRLRERWATAGAKVA